MLRVNPGALGEIQGAGLRLVTPLSPIMMFHSQIVIYCFSFSQEKLFLQK